MCTEELRSRFTSERYREKPCARGLYFSEVALLRGGGPRVTVIAVVKTFFFFFFLRGEVAWWGH